MDMQTLLTKPISLLGNDLRWSPGERATNGEMTMDGIR
jgi:hypothetical protein